MATITSKPDIEGTTPPAGHEVRDRGVGNSGVSGSSVPNHAVPAWPRGESSVVDLSQPSAPGHPGQNHPGQDPPASKPSQRDALQALLAFSALHAQVRRRKALAAKNNGFDTPLHPANLAQAEFEKTEFDKTEFEKDEQFVLDEVLQLVAERGVAITGADGLAIALAENNEIVLRAAAGTVRPDVGARIDRDSAFSGACFRTAQIICCDDTETDPRVNLQACRKLGARSMVAVPLCGRRRVIGLLEAFSTWPFAFNDSDVRNLTLLAELVVGALRPEDEDRFASSAQAAATRLDAPAQPEVAPAIPVSAPSAPATPILSLPTNAKPAVAKADIAQVPIKPADIPLPHAGIASAPLTILNEAKPRWDNSDLQVSSAIESVPAPEISLPLPETPRRLPRMLVALVCIVIAAAFVAGVWWKLKTAQIASVMVTTEKAAAKPAASSATKDAAAENAASDVASDAAEPLNTPATPQELAKFPRVTGVRQWSSADSTTVVLDLEDQVQYEAHRLAGPDRIYFDLHDTQLAPELAGKAVDVGDALLSKVRVAQPVAGMTRVVLETKANTNFSVSLEPNPYRLVVEVSKVGVTPKTAVNLFPGATEQKLAIVVPPPTKEDLQLRARVPKMRIVVDAGHGGWDLGTVGRRGLLEKDLVLEIAQRLGKLLDSRLGAEVILTRNDDNYIPLDERADIANQSQADLFVSVHANYSDLPSARGVETYYTNRFSAPGSKEAGTKDADTHAAKTATAPSLTQADLREKVDQSRRLAASVQRSLYGTLSAENPGLRDRGIKEAGFVVLTESAMPGILAEVSFVSSPTDEQKLRSDGYREEIAEALYKGIARYAASSKNVKMASAK